MIIFGGLAAVDSDTGGGGFFGEGTGCGEGYLAEGCAGEGVLPYPADSGGYFNVGKATETGEGEVAY